MWDKEGLYSEPVQSRIRTILGSTQFDSMPRLHEDNLTATQLARMDSVYKELTELEELLIKYGVIR